MIIVVVVIDAAIDQIAKIRRDARPPVVIGNVALDLDALPAGRPGAAQPLHMAHVARARQIEGHIGGHQQRFRHQHGGRHRQQVALDVVAAFVARVLGSAPRRTEEHGIGAEISAVGHREKIADDELNAIGHPVDGGIVAGDRDFLRIDVDRNNCCI